MYIAAYGWEHPEWAGAFYPEDLPDEWRLDFYCNELQSVVVPADLWAAENAEPGGWIDGLGEATRVYLELAPYILPSLAHAVGLTLAGRLAGFVADGGPPSLPFEPGVPVGIWSREAPQSPPTPGTAWCWPGEGGVPRCRGDGLATAWVGPEPLAPMALRQIVEALAAAGGENALLVVRGGPASLALMRDAEALAALMGL